MFWDPPKSYILVFSLEVTNIKEMGWSLDDSSIANHSLEVLVHTNIEEMGDQ